MAGISRSGDAAPVWLSDENGNVLGTAAFPLATSGGGGGGGGGVVTQPTASNLNAQVVGNVASGATDSGNPVKIGGVATTGVPTTLTNGQRADAWMTINGAIVVGGYQVTGGDAANNTALVSLPGTQAMASQRLLTVANSYFNGTSWDRQRGDTAGAYAVNVASGAAATALTPVTATAATSLVVKNTAGNFFGGSIVAGATAGYLIAYNATAAPAAGATLTANLILGVVPVAASGSAALGDYVVPDRASTGIVLLFSTAVTTYTVPANAAQFLRGRAL